MILDLLIFIALIYILYCYSTKYITNIITKKNINICKKIYSNLNYNSKFKILNNLFNLKMCKSIINEGESIAKINGWETKRHSDYPTTDLEITKTWENYNSINNKINNLKQHFSDLFEIDISKIITNEIFIVKYEYNKQNKLIKHTDGNEFSFIIALNDDYTGGGTYFTKIKKHIDLKIGDALIFSGQNEHKGIKISSGIRYILVGFLNFNKIDYCEDIFEKNII